MKRNDLNKLREKKIEDLQKMVDKKKQELGKLLAERKSKSKKNLKKAKNLRREMSQILTIRREKEIYEFNQKTKDGKEK